MNSSKKGKFFGKINIIDLLIVVIVIGILAGVIYKQKKVNLSSIVEQDDIIIQFYSQEVPEFAAKAVNIGDNAVDNTKSINFGKVTDVKVDDPLTYGVNSEGKNIKSPKPGYKSILVTIKSNGIITDNNIVINGKSYLLGDEMVLRAGKSKLWATLCGAQNKEN